MASYIKYFNRTTIECGIPLISDTSLDWTVYITMNGFEFKDFINVNTNEKQVLKFSAPIIVYSIEPPVAFENALDVEITVWAEPLIDLPTLKCRIQDYETTGTFLDDGTNTYVKCIIPSYQYIIDNQNIPTLPDGSFSVEVTNNGRDYSTSGLTFKFIVLNQIVNISPSTGPDTGGTVISIQVKDLPNDSNSPDIAKCLFPGYSSQNAVYINSQLIQCTTPVLIEHITNVTSTLAYAIV